MAGRASDLPRQNFSAFSERMEVECTRHPGRELNYGFYRYEAKIQITGRDLGYQNWNMQITSFFSQAFII
jgi:hypothetical protein